MSSIMLRGVLLLGLAAAELASDAGVAANEPSSFYVVSVYHPPKIWFYRVLEVKPAGSGSPIRYTRVAPITEACPHEIVQSVARPLEERPARLVKDNNPCAVAPKALRAALAKYRRHPGDGESGAFGIVAQCGSAEVVLALPTMDPADMDRLRHDRPELAHLWNLAWEISTATFGPGDPFQNRSQEDDLVLQRAGQEFAPELKRGRYDKGLAAAIEETTASGLSFGNVLSSYNGPMTQEEAQFGNAPRVLRPETYRFTRYVDPKYPPLARQARIWGNVDLEVMLDRESGAVTSVGVLKGHPLLASSAVDVARQWKFVPDPTGPASLRITVEYAFRCW